MGVDLAPLLHQSTEDQIIPYEDVNDGKHHLTHVVNPDSNMHIWRPGMTAQDVVDTARMLGQVVTALCGYKFIPKRNPEHYPACQICIDVAGMIMREEGE